MAIRKVYPDTDTGKHAEVQTRRNAHGEIVVRFFEGGEHNEAADYFADDLSDAMGTAKFEVNR